MGKRYLEAKEQLGIDQVLADSEESEPDQYISKKDKI